MWIATSLQDTSRHSSPDFWQHGLANSLFLARSLVFAIRRLRQKYCIIPPPPDQLLRAGSVTPGDVLDGAGPRWISGPPTRAKVHQKWRSIISCSLNPLLPPFHPHNSFQTDSSGPPIDPLQRSNGQMRPVAQDKEALCRRAVTSVSVQLDGWLRDRWEDSNGQMCHGCAVAGSWTCTCFSFVLTILFCAFFVIHLFD